MGTEMRRRMAASGLSESFLPRYWSFWALLLGQSLPCMLKLILVRMQRLFSGWTGRTLSLMLRKIWDGWFWLSSRKECILDKDRERRRHWGKCGQSIIDMWDRQFDFMETIRSAEGVLFHMFHRENSTSTATSQLPTEWLELCFGYVRFGDWCSPACAWGTPACSSRSMWLSQSMAGWSSIHRKW